MKEHLKGRIGEDAVNHVATSTFLQYWCYPSPKDENGSGKEICDLLILFKGKALIISVKNYEFKGDYEKYFRLTLKKAISQISGAERKLFEMDGDVVFTHPTRGKHSFDPSEYKTIQRLIVNLSTDAQFHPGSLETKRQKLVHVFNWFAFLKVLEELNTISDFFQYLETREQVCKPKQIIMLCGAEENWMNETGKQFLKYMPEVTGSEPKPTILFSGNELDLLAVYLTNAREFDPNFYDNKADFAFFELDGHWETYLGRKEVQRKKEEEGLSYFWDEVVKREVLYYKDELRIKIATELLALDRYQRRVIGKEYWSFLQQYKNSKDNFTARRFTEIGGCVIAFFIHGDKIDRELALPLMRIAGLGYLEHTGHKLNRLVMIGLNVKMSQFKFLYIEDALPLEGKELEQLKSDLKMLKWFQNIKFLERTHEEYPD